VTYIYYIDIKSSTVYISKCIMPYKISKCRPADVICKCGAIIKWEKMQQHLLSTEHARDMVGCENIEVVDHYQY
jgi:hypothetical protein